MTWRRVALAGVLVAVATAGTAAAAGRTWHPALTITPRGAEPGDPSAAAGTGGEALAAFSSTIKGRSRIEARVRDPANAPWVPVVLSGTFPTAPAPSAAAIETAGRAVVAWRIPGGAIRSAVRDRPHGDWRVVPVAPESVVDDDLGFRSAQATMDSVDRSAALIWAERAGGAWTVRAARRPGTGAAWAETPPLALGPGAAEPSLALSPDGTAAVAWTVPPAPGFFVTGPLHTAVRSTGGAWTAITPLAADGARIPSAAAGYDGRAAIAWQDGCGPTPTVTVAEAGIGTAWGVPQPVAPGQAPRVGATPRPTSRSPGRGVGRPDATPILAAVKPAGAPWPAGRTAEPRRRAHARRGVAGAGGDRRHRARVRRLARPGGAGVGDGDLGAARPGERWTMVDGPVGGDVFSFAMSASSGGNGLACCHLERRRAG